ncbi:hypothetical protein HYE66_03620 [Aggregatibacter actinomycetemcomitans]|nr:hypothetical protein [Aggregatibacter actinomycetemcomitans]
MKRKWKVWWFWVAVFSGFLGVYYSSCNGAEEPLILEEGNSTSWVVWRPLDTSSSSVRLSFNPYLSNGEMRKDLGDWNSAKRKDEKDVSSRWDEPVWFDNPGEPIELEITLNEKHCLMEALPADIGYMSISRTLFGSDNLDIPQQFGGAHAVCGLVETFGFNKWSAKVTKVSPKLQGEKVTVITDSPITFKSSDRNYSWMTYPMLLSAFFLVILLIWAAVVLLIDYSEARRKTSKIKTFFQ